LGVIKEFYLEKIREKLKHFY